ncbi:hypothetical protein [Ciceribacter ferrooxidans]|uniref:Uncharacterized protein n=1 Tax=Ciceribacter ferrooxidans TaxID=2509717 RepID=A0A4Q2SVK0_9HYPH|nr:hypothetical protein [Ciceribacter ferrooxidans]RYC10075.1 hypothetical protein EUU22_18550 [Ciceribacter ferrooxidans]
MVLAAAMKRRRHEHDEMAWAAWHTAYLTAYAPQKAREFVKLEKLLSRTENRQTAKSGDWRSQLAKVTAWVKGR